jgi:hypothetical protein
VLLHEHLEVLVDVLQRKATERDRAAVPLAVRELDVEEARDLV